TGTALSATSGSTLAVNSTGNINLSGGGALQLKAQNATTGAITFGTSGLQTVQGGGSILLSSRSITLNSGSGISAQGASIISIDSGTGSTGLTITGPSGGTGTIATTGGTIGITPTSGFGITFDKSSTTAATINLTGGDLTTTASNTTQINSLVTVQGDRNITVNANGTTFSNAGTLTT